MLHRGLWTNSEHMGSHLGVTGSPTDVDDIAHTAAACSCTRAQLDYTDEVDGVETAAIEVCFWRGKLKGTPVAVQLWGLQIGSAATVANAPSGPQRMHCVPLEILEELSKVTVIHRSEDMRALRCSGHFAICSRAASRHRAQTRKNPFPLACLCLCFHCDAVIPTWTE